MTTPSARTLRLLSLLQTHRHWSGEDLADRLGVSLRTVRRDVDRLRELGYPVRATPGVDGGYQLAPGTALPPLVLDEDDAVALAVGLQLAAHAPVSGLAEASVRVLATLSRVMPPRLARRVDALQSATDAVSWGGPGATVAADALVVLAQACRDAERVEFDYRAATGEESHRTVEPLRLVRLGLRWYLVGYDLRRHDWRCFRLDRLTTPAPTGDRFRPRAVPGGDAAEYVRASVGGAAPSCVVEAVVRAPTTEVEARIGRWASVEPDGTSGDQCRVRLTADRFEWPAMALGMTGAELTVLGPPEFVEYLARWGERFTRATRAPA